MAGNNFSPNNVDLRGFIQDNLETGETGFPAVDLQLIENLESMFPFDITMDDNEREIGAKVARKAIFRFLRAKHKEQTEPNE